MRAAILLLAVLAACTAPPRTPPPEQSASAATSTSPADGRIRIADARKLPLGSRVTVEGQVTVPTGGYDAGFAIQDSTAGIYVAADTMPRFPGDTGMRAQLRQGVRVTGTLVDNHGFLTVKPAADPVVSYGYTLPARGVRTGEVGEATEALWVSFDGRVTAPVVDDRPYGWKIMVDDGSGAVQVFVPAHRRFDPAAIRVGQRLMGTGLGAQYDSTYEIISYPIFSPTW